MQFIIFNASCHVEQGRGESTSVSSCAIKVVIKGSVGNCCTLASSVSYSSSRFDSPSNLCRRDQIHLTLRDSFKVYFCGNSTSEEDKQRGQKRKMTKEYLILAGFHMYNYECENIFKCKLLIQDTLACYHFDMDIFPS